MPTYWIEAESFHNLGGWVIEQQSIAQMGSPYLMAHGLGVPVADATTDFLCEEGTYHVFARTRDWTAVWNVPSSAGRFQILIDGAPLPAVLGTNGADWAWQPVGTVHLDAGTHALALHDLTGFNGRCDALALTTDEELTLPDSGAALAELRRELSWHQTETEETPYDLIVAGGGIAGICLALTAKRLGNRVLLIHDRDILGGCNSSEVQVCMGGNICLPPYEKLGGLVRQLAPMYTNPRTYGAEFFEDHRKKAAFLAGCAQFSGGRNGEYRLALGEHALSIEMEGKRITAIETVDIHTGAHRKYYGRLFADCTGDAVISRLAGCEVMYGREGRETFSEDLAGETYQKMVMGHSLRWYTTRQAAPAPFPDIDWGIPFSEETCYHTLSGDWEQETGFYRDMAEETEYIRDYGLRAIFSNWNFQKNLTCRKEEYACDALQWISPLGGKRESYRVVGDHILIEQDIETPILY